MISNRQIVMPSCLFLRGCDVWDFLPHMIQFCLVAPTLCHYETQMQKNGGLDDCMGKTMISGCLTLTLTHLTTLSELTLTLSTF